MIAFMKNTGKKASSLVCCLFFFLMMSTGQEQGIHYYLQTCELLTYKEEPPKHIFVARKYVKQKDGRTRVEEFKYFERTDSISSAKMSLFRVKDRTLIRYLGKEDTQGQIYLKVQPDTSFVFKYEDSAVDEILGTTFRYLGRDSSLRNGKVLYKFRGNRYEVVLDVYLDKNFILERTEALIHRHVHNVMERVDSTQVPESFRKQVRNYKSELDLEEQDNEVRETQHGESGKSFWNGLLLGSIFFFSCVFYLIRREQKHLKHRSFNKNTRGKGARKL